VVVAAPFWGNHRFAAPRFRLGRTTIHEVGHYLNLLHLWGNDEGDFNELDLVGDTPPASGPQYSFENGNPQCYESISCQQERMTNNYMEYFDDPCLNAFTEGQIQRMDNAIQRYRSKLVNISNVKDCGCEELFVSLNTFENPFIAIYPNPVEQFFNIDLFGTQTQSLDINLFDSKGRLVKVYENVNSPETYRYELSGLQAGIYIADITLEYLENGELKNYRERFKLVKVVN